MVLSTRLSRLMLVGRLEGRFHVRIIPRRRRDFVSCFFILDIVEGRSMLAKWNKESILQGSTVCAAK